MKIKKVTVIFKTHLDVGFTDLAANVVKKYFDTFIVNAVKTADHFRKNHKDKRYVWTVGSWLIYEYFERGTPAQKKFLSDAIKRGDIVWHALPFTTHCELADESLYRYGISLSSELDARFGKKTVAAKMTDVPGHTRGIIAPLVEAGIKFMHIGVNPASAVPELPALSRWKDSRGNSIILAYQKDYGDTFSVPGSDSICHVAVTGDNLGPHSPEAAEKVYAMLEEKYPDAKIAAGSFDDMYASVKSVEKSLPVIENEIGDSWIHGTGTDPLKVARFKALCGLRNKWLAEKPSIASKKEFKDFSRALLQITEHTWGLDEKKTIKGEKACRGEAFKEFRKTAGAKRFEKSWAEKRAIIKTAVSALKTESLRKEALAALRSVSPRFPDFSKLKALGAPSFETAFFKGSLDPKCGAVNSLVLKKGKLVIADEKHPLGLFSAQTYSLDSYARFRSQYLRLDLEWAILDFTKPYIPASVKGKIYTASKLKFYSKKAVGADIVIAHLLMPSKADSGMPEELAIEYRFPHEKPVIEVKLNWKNKETARLPHGLWFSFLPLQDKKSSWTFSKLGEPVAPDSVISKGGKTLHSVSGEILCKSGKNAIRFESFDAPLVSPGKPSLLDFSSKNPEMQGGIHYNLYNNIWGTNFPMWYGDDGQFRFRISFS